MKQYEVLVKCQMEVSVAVRASSEDEVREWVESQGASLLSAIETPVHTASGVELVSIYESSAAGFCFDIELPVDEELF